MTISSETARNDYVGNGVLDTYPFTFEIYLKTDLAVYVGGVLKTVDVHYTIPLAGINNPVGGNIVFTAGNIPAASAAIAIILNLPLTQLTDYTEGDKFAAEAHETALDRAVKIMQMFSNKLKRTLKVSDSSILEDLDVPVAANEILAWNSDADGIVTIPVWSSGDPLPPHGSDHQNGGSDEISVLGLSGLLADGQTPLAHASSHQSGGSDPLSYVNRNLIINGGCQVNQRVTAHTLVKDVYGICIDRFYGMATGTLVSAGTLTQDSASGIGRTGYALKFSGVTLTGTGIIYLRHRIESANALNLKNQKGSFSCLVKHDVGSSVNYTVTIRKPTALNDFTAVTEISNSGAIAIPTGVETALEYEDISMGDCSYGIEIEVKIAAGAITTKNFWFAELQLEEGSGAGDFEYKRFSDELNACLRYYAKTFAYATAPVWGVTSGALGFTASKATTGGTTFTWFLPVPMIKTPTIVTYNPNSSSAEAYNVATGTNSAGITTATGWTNEKIITVLITGVAGWAVGDRLALHITASAEL